MDYPETPRDIQRGDSQWISSKCVAGSNHIGPTKTQQRGLYKAKSLQTNCTLKYNGKTVGIDYGQKAYKPRRKLQPFTRYANGRESKKIYRNSVTTNYRTSPHNMGPPRAAKSR